MNEEDIYQIGGSTCADSGNSDWGETWGLGTTGFIATVFLLWQRDWEGGIVDSSFCYLPFDRVSIVIICSRLGDFSRSFRSLLDASQSDQMTGSKSVPGQVILVAGILDSSFQTVKLSRHTGKVIVTTIGDYGAAVTGSIHGHSSLVGNC